MRVQTEKWEADLHEAQRVNDSIRENIRLSVQIIVRTVGGSPFPGTPVPACLLSRLLLRGLLRLQRCFSLMVAAARSLHSCASAV